MLAESVVKILNFQFLSLIRSSCFGSLRSLFGYLFAYSVFLVAYSVLFSLIRLLGFAYSVQISLFGSGFAYSVSVAYSVILHTFAGFGQEIAMRKHTCTKSRKMQHLHLFFTSGPCTANPCRKPCVEFGKTAHIE